MRAFIIRPFGKKKDGSGTVIDFDAVERLLINPALERFSISGRTTMDILRQGNIRLDMFQRLLTADLVIADVSVHNANVFYELGVRHALRDKRTFLIRCRHDGPQADEVPFDLKTDRYLSYPLDDPAACLEDLIKGLYQTINSEAEDSPVFMLLPELQAQDPARFLPVPLDFREEVERAAAAREPGDLALLAREARGFEWESEGLRLIGRTQISVRAFEGARETWEAVRDLDLRDLEANTWLGTIYQRLGDLTRSDQALKRALGTIQQGIGDPARSGKALESALGRDRLGGKERAEIQSLLGRNAKARWTQEWQAASPEQRRLKSLTSPFLEESFNAYSGAFYEDLNHFYSGLNALAMLTILVELAQAHPDVWATRFEDDEEAERALESYGKKRERLAGVVGASLEATTLRLRREGKSDLWAEISEADYSFLTSKRPARVASAYSKALAGSPDFAVDSARRQVVLYQQLGVLAENAEAALSVMPDSAAAGAAPAPESARRVLLFTGHMIDRQDRPTTRFPANMVVTAREAIRKAVVAEAESSGGVAYGVAGGASGGDILFHMVCEQLDIPTRMFLAMPRDEYVAASVAHAGPEWVTEFDRLSKSRPVRVLCESKELPRWLQDKPDYGVWQRSNLWMLYNALASGSENVTLIALWDRQGGDGPGGTADMVEKAERRGAKTVILDATKIFGA